MRIIHNGGFFDLVKRMKKKKCQKNEKSIFLEFPLSLDQSLKMQPQDHGCRPYEQARKREDCFQGLRYKKDHEWMFPFEPGLQNPMREMQTNPLSPSRGGPGLLLLLERLGGSPPLRSRIGERPLDQFGSSVFIAAPLCKAASVGMLMPLLVGAISWDCQAGEVKEAKKSGC